MSTFSALVIADADLAGAIGRSDDPWRDFGGEDIGGTDLVMIICLDAFFHDRELEELLKGPDYEAGYIGGDEGPWVFTLPHRLVVTLAALDHAAIDAAVAYLDARDATQYWPEGTVAAVLRQMAGQARIATASGSALHFWYCM